MTDLCAKGQVRDCHIIYQNVELSSPLCQAVPYLQIIRHQQHKYAHQTVEQVPRIALQYVLDSLPPWTLCHAE